ncbi:surfeit locus protein 2 [Dorcoceras hygrometricum]|nr:surfeit locus protein 2 [Dorcoceras hygrometricum]
MGKKKGAENPNPNSSDVGEQKEGFNLLGPATFEPLENGRLRCVETGHELPAHSRDSYSLSKHCRLGLIDSALAHKKPPLSIFRQDPVTRSKLICKLTGVTINKSEEHIWKHINGKRFLSMLEKKEAEKENQSGRPDEEKEEKKKKKNEEGKLKKKKKKKKTKKKTKELEEIGDETLSEVRDSSGKESDSGEDVDFWIPPVGNRWDNDDGGDRWGSGSESDDDAGEGYVVPMYCKCDDITVHKLITSLCMMKWFYGADAGAEGADFEAGELSKRTKRMSLEIGPSSFASRKKKTKLVAES